MKVYWSLWVPAWQFFFMAGILSYLFPVYSFIFFCIGCLFLFFLRYLFHQPFRTMVILLIIIFSLLNYGIGYFRTKYSQPNLTKPDNLLEKTIILQGFVTDWPVKKTKHIEFLMQSKQMKLMAIIPLQTETDVIDLVKGDRFKATGKLTKQKNQYTSPLSDAKKLEQTSSFAFFQIKDQHAILIQKNGLPSRFYRYILSIRKLAWNKLCAYSLSPAFTHFLGALWLGLEKENFPLQTLFQKIGLSHVLAISGSNFYWLAGLLLGLMTWWKWKEKEKSTAIIVILFIYCALIGFQASVVRAWMMISLMLLARSRLEGYHSLYAMLYTAWFMLLWNPLWLFDIGFQLSFIGCSAFILFPTPLSKGFGASITTAPLVAFRFHLISLSSLLTNILVLPVLAVFYLLAWAFLLPGKIGFIPLKIGEYFWNGLIFLMDFLSRLPYSFCHIRSFPFWMLLGYYLLFFGLLLSQKCSIPAKKITLSYTVLLFTLPVFIVLYPGKSPYMRVIYLNVGQGDATLIQTRSGKTILVDTGPGKKENESFDAGEKILLPQLRKAGVNRIDLLIISHYHDDHYGGLSAVLQHMPSVQEIILPDTKSAESSLFQQQFSVLMERNKIHYWCGHHRWKFDELVVELFSPDCDESSWSESENSRSLTFLLTFKEISFLFTGDNETDVERTITDQYGEKLQCDVIKIPHHGSQTSSTLHFIEMVSPRLAVISCGSKAIFRHPSKETLTTLEECQIPYHITFLHGSLQILTDGYRFDFTPESV